jgi:hypothetical protein
MADAKKLREQAARCRAAAEKGTRGGEVCPNAYLHELAEYYDKEADAAEVLEKGR